ncbi:MAG: hypothetical protein ACO1NQ_01105 [Flavobacteriales bacterium]
MRTIVVLLSLAPLATWAQGKYITKGEHNGVGIAYRWNHSVGKPSELHLRLSNTTEEDRVLSLEIDLSYQGLTVETLSADTCIKAGRTMTGKLSGIYFVPTRLTTEQLKSGDADAEFTRTDVTPGECP